MIAACSPWIIRPPPAIRTQLVITRVAYSPVAHASDSAIFDFSSHDLSFFCNGVVVSGQATKEDELGSKPGGGGGGGARRRAQPHTSSSVQKGVTTRR